MRPWAETLRLSTLLGTNPRCSWQRIRGLPDQATVAADIDLILHPETKL